MLSPHELVTFLTRNQFLSATQGEQVLRDAAKFSSSIQLCTDLVQRGWLTPYQQSQILVNQGDKLIIGPYRLQTPIGEGGMGMVFKAIQPRLDRVVALKIIRPQVLAARPEILSRFHREAKAIAQLNHPNIVLLYDADEANNTHFIAMEYVEGHTLEKIVRTQGPMAIKQACDYMYQCSLGLQHAYEVGLVHRDIKPSNILISNKANLNARSTSTRLSRPQLVTIRDRERQQSTTMLRATNQWGTVKILDMGLARLTGGNDEDQSGQQEYTPLTRAGALLGTPDFIAPEQARDARRVDIRADIYSLGCTFYYVLTGKPPFPGGTDVQKLIRHQSEKAFPAEELRPGIPTEVLQILDRMLQKRPEDRYPTPNQLADAFEHVLNPAIPATPVPPKSPPLAETPAVAETPIPEAPVLVTNYIVPPPPDVRTVVSQEIRAAQSTAAFNPMTGIPQLVKSTPPHTVIMAHTGIVSGLALSPDQRFLASAGIDGRVRLWDLSTPQYREVAHFPKPGAEFHSVAFAPHMNYVVVGGNMQGTARVWRWECNQGTIAEWGAYQGQKISVPALSFTPDGNRLAAAIGSFAVTWKVSGAKAGKGDILQGRGKNLRSLQFTSDGKKLLGAGEGKGLMCYSFGWLGASLKTQGEGHTDIVNHLSISPDGKRLATGGLDRTVMVWDVTNPKLETSISLFGHTGSLKYVRFLQDGRTLISVSESGQLISWDTIAYTKNYEVQLDHPYISSIVISDDGKRLIAATTDGKVSLFNLNVPSNPHAATAV